eukprot:4844377-Prymnesium_polylepis.1
MPHPQIAPPDGTRSPCQCGAPEARPRHLAPPGFAQQKSMTSLAEPMPCSTALDALGDPVGVPEGEKDSTLVG